MSIADLLTYRCVWGLATTMWLGAVVVQSVAADPRPTFIELNCNPSQNSATIKVIHEAVEDAPGAIVHSLAEVAANPRKTACTLTKGQNLSVEALKGDGSPKGDALIVLINDEVIFRHTLAFDVNQWNVRVSYESGKPYSVSYCPDSYDLAFDYPRNYSGGVGKCMLEHVANGRILDSHVTTR